MIRTATANDIPALTELFRNNISGSPEYISHGEIQMGVATDRRTLASDWRGKWENYIGGKISSAAGRVMLEEHEGKIAGFIVLDIESDNDAPFGVICDIVVASSMRGEGIGTRLLEKGMAWLKSRNVAGLYLESGIDNHQAHRFFERHGFRMVSHVFKFEEDAP